VRATAGLAEAAIENAFGGASPIVITRTPSSNAPIQEMAVNGPL
jgi:hypothetical protein